LPQSNQKRELCWKEREGSPRKQPLLIYLQDRTAPALSYALLRRLPPCYHKHPNTYNLPAFAFPNIPQIIPVLPQNSQKQTWAYLSNLPFYSHAHIPLIQGVVFFIIIGSINDSGAFQTLCMVWPEFTINSIL
jgi:hypothetical protein